MTTQTKKSLPSKVLFSFAVALRGIWWGSQERTLRLHWVAAIFVIVTGVCLRLSPTEWGIISLSIGLVMSLELMNSAIENLADISRDSLGLDYAATTKLRDIAAGSVLFASLSTAAVAAVILLPKVFSLM